MENDRYSLVVKNIIQLVSNSSSSRAIQAEEWLENQVQQNPQLHHLLRKAIMDNNVPSQAHMMCAISLNNFLINSLQSADYNQLFTFTRQIIRDPTFPQQYYNQLERFIVEFVALAEQRFIQQWLMLYRELLNQKLNIRAFSILASFTLDKIKDSDFIYFITLAIPFSIENILNLVSIGGALDLHQWSKALCQILTRLLSKKKFELFQQNLKIISNNGEITRIILMVYELQSSFQNGYLCTQSNLTQLNVLKGTFVELQSLIVQGYSQSNHVFKGTLHYNLLTQTLPRLSLSLLTVCKDYDMLNVQLETNEFIKHTLKLFTNALSTYQVGDLFVPFTQSLITNVIFRALLLTEQETYCFKQENAQHTQFVHYIEDMFHKHQSDTFKSCSAALLQGLGDGVDGVVSSTSTIAINSLKYNLKLIQKNQGIHLNNSQALIVLGILTSFYHDRQDVAQAVGSFLSQNSEVILNTLSAIDLTILYVFLGYIDDVIFPKNDDGFVYLKYASICKGNPIAQYAALTFLSYHIKNIDSLQIFKILVQRTKDSKYGLVWTILRDFVKQNTNIITQQIAISFVDVVLARIQSQIQKPRQLSTHTMAQAINILRQFVQPKKKFIKDKPIFENTLWKAFEMFKLSNFNNMDDLINLFNDYVKCKKDIDQRILLLMPLIDQRLKQDQNLYTDIFAFANQVVFKIKFESANTEFMKILEWCLRPLSLSSIKQYERSQWILLLQLLLQKNLQIMYPDIVIKTMSILGQYRSTTIPPPSLLRLYSANLVFYSAPINFPKLDFIKPILSLDFSLEGYSQQYTKKVIVSQFIKILYTETEIQILTLVLSGIVNILTNFRYKQPRTKKRNKDKIPTYNMTKYNQSVLKLKSETKKIDIFQVFSETLQKMKTANTQAMNKIINGLSPVDLQRLKKVIVKRYVPNQVKARKVIKIKGAKENVDLKQIKLQKMQSQQMNEQNQQNQGQNQDEQQSQNIKQQRAQKRQLKKLKKNNKKV